MKFLCLLLSCFITTALASPTPCAVKKLPSLQIQYCLYGDKKPTLVFIGPMGSDMSVWPPSFLAQLKTFSSVLIYNRAGYGKSKSQTNTPVTAKSVANQLHALITALNIQQPIVLVAHSIGGVYALYYVKHYPVAGLVMIDADGAQEPKINNPFQSKIPPTPNSMDAKEMAGFNVSMDEANSTSTFPNIPLLVISATNHGSDPDIENKWQALQSDIVKLSPQGKQIIAKGSGHFVYVDQPGVVVEAMRAFTKNINGEH